MRVALTKVFDRQRAGERLANKVATLGKRREKVPAGQISQAMLNEEFLRQKMKWQQEEMMQNYQASNTYSNVGNAVQQRIENPFSSK
ncbi:MAG: hypothetical protein IPH85_11855 [Ignavibacteria bacterium]|nr:hypothetical protein [Ignavibacteria bacterium]